MDVQQAQSLQLGVVTVMYALFAMLNLEKLVLNRSRVSMLSSSLSTKANL